MDKLEAAYKLRRLRRETFPFDLIPLHPDELRDPIYSRMLSDAKPLCKRPAGEGEQDNQGAYL